MLSKQQIAANILAKSVVDNTTGCFNINVKYARPLARIGKLHTSAARVLWICMHGELSRDIFVCHRCDNPKCVNPAHLFLGSSKDNMQDKVTKNRHAPSLKTHCPKGHEYSSENTHIDPKGYRKCKKCWDIQNKCRQQKNRVLRYI